MADSAPAKGEWVWDEAAGELAFQRTAGEGTPWKPGPWLQVNNPEISDHEGTVSLHDVKVVAVGLIDKTTVSKTRPTTCELFDSCINTGEMDELLWATLIYYSNLKEHRKALSNDNISVPGSIGDGCRETLRYWEEKLSQSRVNLGESYSRLILGLGHTESHHCQAGRLRVSRTQTDRELFEVLYEFLLYTVWVVFSYTDWEVIHQELGGFFRTPQFNRDFNITDGTVRLEGFGDIKKNSEQYLSYKIVYERPLVGKMKELHSEAHISYLPHPRDKHSWLFETACKPPKQEKVFLPNNWSTPETLGIIGTQKSLYDPLTLRLLGEVNNAESADDTESLVSGIIEDDGSDSDSF